MPLGKRTAPYASRQENEPADRNFSVRSDVQNGMTPDRANKTVAATFFQTEEPQHQFKDVILNAETYGAIQDVLVLYEKRELLFVKWGLEHTHRKHNRSGINLYGPSGTGKSMAAHAIASQLGRRILTVDYSQIESKYVGETSKNLVELFRYAKESDAILFFDEADALLSRRVTNMSNSTDVSVNQTRSVLLMLINEYDDLILFATNFIANYDTAFLRRMFAHVKFELPDEENRFKLWRQYIPREMPTDADIRGLAVKYDAVSGADISNAVLNAALKAARQNGSIVRQEYFEEAIERTLRSKEANEDLGTLVSRRVVSKDYMKSQLGGELNT